MFIFNLYTIRVCMFGTFMLIYECVCLCVCRRGRGVGYDGLTVRACVSAAATADAIVVVAYDDVSLKSGAI